MAVVDRCLADDGLFLLQTIGGNCSMTTLDPWIERYIFPNGLIPSSVQITRALEGRFMIEDWHNFGPDYDRTLMAWWRNFEAAWPDLAKRYGERFHRLWCYYLLSSAGAFRAREIQLWQLVLSKNGAPDGYRAPR
jgi:cyclopropane-fatty-acyl-phospholipid synthase